MTAEPAEQSRKRPRLEQQTGGPEAVPDEIWLGILRERSETNLLFFNKLVPYIESNYIVFALGHLHRSIFSIRNDIPPTHFLEILCFYQFQCLMLQGAHFIHICTYRYRYRIKPLLDKCSFVDFKFNFFNAFPGSEFQVRVRIRSTDLNKFTYARVLKKTQ